MQVEESKAGIACAYEHKGARSRNKSKREIWCKRKNRWIMREEWAGIEMPKRRTSI